MEQLEDRCLLSAASDQFVSAAYQALLHQPPDAATLARWSDQLDHGASRAQVVLSIEQTGAYRTQEVQDLHRRLLGEPPNSRDLDAGVGFLMAGGRVERLEVKLLGSRPYFHRRGHGTDAGFLAVLYRDVLHRRPGAHARDTLGRLLREGVAPGAVAAWVVHSPEARAKFVRGLYLQVLHQPVPSRDLRRWVRALGHGALQEQVLAQVLARAEFPAPPSAPAIVQPTAGSALPVPVAPPTIVITGPAPGLLTSHNVTVMGVVSDPAGAAALQAQVDAGPPVGVALDPGGAFRFDTGLPLDSSADGGHTVHLLATDQGNHTSAAADLSFTLDTQAPAFAIQAPAPGLLTKTNVTVSGQVSDAGSGVAGLQAQVDAGPAFPVAVDAGGFRFDTALALDGSADARHTVRLTATDGLGNGSAPVVVSFTLDTSNPAVGAPPLDLTTATTLGPATAFLYTGDDPVQKGVAPDTIDPIRVAVLRGRAMTRDGAPLKGVTVRVVNHPEFGYTTTHNDGWFDLAVNGGGLLTMEYTEDGYLAVRRQVQAPWQDYAVLPDVVLIPQDAAVTTIDLDAGTPIQVARGSVVTDGSGPREATLLFAQGTQAVLTLPEGTAQPVSTLHVRATEYTVGANGPEAMPADLPPSSGYTYAVELSADEEVAAGATGVRFDRPVSFYVENFLHFPVGEAVPVGFYNRDDQAWEASDSGRIVKVLGVTNGLAALDVDGSGQAANAAGLAALGISDAERQSLATLYQPGQSLWRSALSHFSSWDGNWGFGPPNDAAPPDQPPPDQNRPLDDPATECGSIIAVQNQTLGEQIAVAGTPFRISYQSDRMADSAAQRTLRIPLSGDHVPVSLRHIILDVYMAGRRFHYDFPAGPNQSYDFIWDGKDAYGRTLQGAAPVLIQIGYAYGGVYQRTYRFDPGGGISSGGRVFFADGDSVRKEVILWQGWQTSITHWDATSQGLGGWSLDVQHAYDPVSRVLHLGDGSQRTANALSGAVITTVAGGGTGGDGGLATQAHLFAPEGVAVGPDGSLYVADGMTKVRRVGPDGIITTVAGSDISGFSGDGGPATQARFSSIRGIALGPDGSLYVTDGGRVRRVGPDGIVTTVAGMGSLGSYDDGIPATQAVIAPYGLAVAPDGNLYIVDRAALAIRRVGADGIITTVAGGRRTFNQDEHIPATEAYLFNPNSVAVGPTGELYIGASGRVRRVNLDGTLETVAGNGATGTVGGGDGGPSLQASLGYVYAVAVGPDNSLYIADGALGKLRKVGPDQVITTVAGIGAAQLFSGEAGPAKVAHLGALHGVALAPDGSLYVADWNNSRVLRVSAAMPGVSLGDVLIPSEDGAEIYRFSTSGRHLETRDALTGASVYQFGYDGAGRLTSVTDRDGNLTTIQRTADGTPAAIVAPGGQLTRLTLNDNRYLTSITDPAGDANRFTYTSGGLMTGMTDPRDGQHHFGYDDLGRLTRDDNNGSDKTLARTAQSDGYTVTLTDAMEMTSTYQVQTLPAGGQRRTDTDAAGLQTVTVIGFDGSRTVTLPDGTVEKLQLGPDPRFGMAAPVVSSLTITTPGGLTSTLSETRSVTLSDPNNPLSLTREIDTVTFNGAAFTTTFDADAGTITTRSPQGRTAVTSLDSRGRVIRSQVSGLTPLQFAYDAHGQLTTITQGTRRDTLTYDSQMNLAGATDALSRTAAFGYDPAGRLTQETLPDGRVIQVGYDANGNVTSVTPPGRPAHAFAYDAMDMVESYTAPDVGAGASQTQYAYDMAGMLTSITQPDGTALGLVYDDAGRLSIVTQPGRTVRFGYDPATGNLKTVTVPDVSTLTYGYDGGLLTDTTWSGTVSGSVHHAFDSNFRITSESVNSANAVSFAFDRDGLLTRAGDLTLSRDAQNGRLTGTTLGVVTDALSYDGFGEATGYQAAADGATLYAVQDTPDALGRVSQRTETVGGVTHTYGYTYDLAGRLTEVTRDGVALADYAYDANGNRLSSTDAGGTLSGSYDNQDRLLAYGSNTYAYGSDGTLQSKTDTATNQTTSYTYDALGNLLGVSLPDGRRIDYVVDGENWRIGKKVDGTLVQGFLYDGGLNPVAELDGAGNVVSRFVYASRNNVPDYLVKGGVTYRVLTDSLGSVRLVVNATTGAVVQRLDYDAFGNVTEDTNPGFQPFGFAGGLYDQDTGLVRFGERDHDAQTGRWTAKDPILFAGGQANLYAYVSGDPINHTDHSGLDWRDDLHIEAEIDFLRENGATQSEIDARYQQLNLQYGLSALIALGLGAAIVASVPAAAVVGGGAACAPELEDTFVRGASQMSEFTEIGTPATEAYVSEWANPAALDAYIQTFKSYIQAAGGSLTGEAIWKQGDAARRIGEMLE